MSHAVFNWIKPKLMPPTVKSVALVLADCHNSKTGRCDPSIERIAEWTCLSERSVSRAIKWLESANIMHPMRKNGERSSYEFAMPTTDTVSGVENDPTPPTPDTLSGGPPTLCHSPYKRNQKGTGSVMSDELNPKEETDSRPLPTSKPKSTRSRPVPDPDFDAFWTQYPKKAGEKWARKAWKEAKPPIDEVLAALDWQTESKAWQKDGGQWIPNPSTWIEDKRWLWEQARDDACWQPMGID